MNRLTLKMLSHFFQTIIMVVPLLVYSQSYSWKQVAPFPYYSVNYIIKGNNTYLAFGRIIDSVKEFTDHKNEPGITPFFLISSDAKTWQQTTHFTKYPADKIDSSRSEEKIIPHKIFFVNNTFVSIALNEKKEKGIYFSDSGTEWHFTGINASSVNFIHDRLIVEHDLRFSVSVDGKKWNTYVSDSLNDPGKDKKNVKEYKTVSIIAQNPSLVSFNGDSTLGYYTDSSYVITDNDRSVGISHDGVHWQVVERPIINDSPHLENSIGYTYGNHRFVYVNSTQDGGESIFSSGDGKKWEKSTIDTMQIKKEFENLSSIAGFNQIFFKDSLFFITRVITLSSYSYGGITEQYLQYVSTDGKNWQRYQDASGSLAAKPPEQALPGEWRSSRLDSLGGGFVLGPNGTLEPVIMSFFLMLLYDKNRFVLPVDYYKTYLQSPDGYGWQYKKWDIDATLLLTSDPYYKENHTFVELNCRTTSLDRDDSAENEQYRQTCYVKISKDKKRWDKVYIDSLTQESRYTPVMRKYSDELIISMTDKGCWQSADGIQWKALDISKSERDSSRAFAKCSTSGNDQIIYIFPNGSTKLSNSDGTQWFNVENTCYGANAVSFGNKTFVAVGENGKIWVLQKM